MRILVTGGRGYLGSSIADYLSKNSYEVLKGTRIKTDCSVEEHEDDTVIMDWGNTGSLVQVCKNIDLVIHAAGMSSVDCAVNPLAALEFNGVETNRILTAAVKSGVRSFIYLSTAHVYKDPMEGLINEKTTPSNLHPYATSHRAGEDAVLYAKKKGLINGLVLRISNIFGAPISSEITCWNLLINDICRQAVTKKSIALSSDGQSYRNFIPIKKFNEAIGKIIQNDICKTRAIMNIGGDKSRKVTEIANMVGDRCMEVLGYSPKIEYLPEIDKNKFQKFYSAPIELKYESLYPIIKVSESELISSIDDLLIFCSVFKH